MSDSPPSRMCAVTRAYRAMPEEDRDTFRKAITHPEVTGGMLAAALRVKGYNVDHPAIDHFRRKLRTGKATL